MSHPPTGLRSLAFVATAAVFAVSCADDPTVTAPPAQLNSTVLSQVAAPPQFASLDQRFAAVAAAAPGFGGAFYAEDGSLKIFLIDEEQEQQARDALGSIAEGRTVEVLQGQFDFRDLLAWRLDIQAEVLGSLNVVSLDIDEGRNRILIGMESAGVADQVRPILTAAGVPAEAVVFREVEPVRFAATLRDYVRPVKGGLQIAFSGHLCTLGFNAEASGVSSYVTNSHCTDVQGGVENTRHYQPSTSYSSYAIGTESADPQYQTGRYLGHDCPIGRRCRLSDAALGTYDAGVSFSLGKIARTTAPGIHSPGSITIDGASPEFTIVSEEPSPLFGDTLSKMGRTTGWTRGKVTQTCVDTNVSESDVTLFCQEFVNADVGRGDSGSPVFRQSGTSSAVLYGILWGGTSTHFVFSSMQNIEDELGALTTVPPPPPLRVYIDGPTVIEYKATYTWEAMPSNGSGSYSYQWYIRYHDTGSTYTLGTSKTQSKTVYYNDNTFDMIVRVVSGFQSATDTLTVNECIDTPNDCFAQ